MMGTRQNEPESEVWRQIVLRKRWLEQCGPVYEDREVIVTEDFKELGGLKLSIDSELIYFSAEIGSTVTIKVRVK